MKQYQMTISKKSTTGYDNKEHLANVAIKISYNILFMFNSMKMNRYKLNEYIYNIIFIHLAILHFFTDYITYANTLERVFHMS